MIDSYSQSLDTLEIHIEQLQNELAHTRFDYGTTKELTKMKQDIISILKHLLEMNEINMLSIANYFVVKAGCRQSFDGREYSRPVVDFLFNYDNHFEQSVLCRVLGSAISLIVSVYCDVTDRIDFLIFLSNIHWFPRSNTLREKTIHFYQSCFL